MKIVALSVEYDYKNYKDFSSILQKAEKLDDFSEFAGFQEKLLSDYKNEYRSPIQFFKIDWGNIIGSKNIKENKFGKPYNADAPLDAAKQIVKYATHVLKIGKGNYHINKLAEEKGLPEIKIEQSLKQEEKKSKKYKF